MKAGLAHDSIRKAIAEALRRYPVDVVHLHGVDFADYLPVEDVPVLVTLHLPLHWYKPDALTVTRPNTFFHCVSRSQAETFPKTLPMLPALENGVSSDLFRHRGIRKRQFAAALGRICPEKGFHLALRACRQAHTPMLLAGKVYPFREHQAYFAEEIVPELDWQRRYIGPVAMRGKCRLLSAASCLMVLVLPRKPARWLPGRLWHAARRWWLSRMGLCRKLCRTGKRDFSCETLMISRMRYGRASLSILKSAERWRCSGSRRIAWSKTISLLIAGFWRARAGCRGRPDLAERDRGSGANRWVRAYASPVHRLRIG